MTTYTQCNLFYVAEHVRRSSQQVHRPKTRVPTYKRRELAKGNFIIKRGDITLLDCIGEGVNVDTSQHFQQLVVVYIILLSRRVWHRLQSKSKLQENSCRKDTERFVCSISALTALLHSLTPSPGDLSPVEVNKLVEESLKMSRFRHAHVMDLLGVCLDTDSAAPYIIMPYMAHGSLLQLLK